MKCLFLRAMIVALLALQFTSYGSSAAEKPDAVKPDAVKPDAVKPDAVKPDAVKPDAVKPDAVKPDAVKPDAVKPDAVKPDAVKPDAIKPDGGKSPGASSPANTLVFGKDKQYEKAASALFLLFAVAVLLENAFSALFRWKVFLAYFSSGAKIIIMFVASFIVVTAFELDILASLVGIFKDQGQESGMMSRIVTSLILAGGSAAVFNIMKSLGIRTTIQESQINPQPPPNKAWVAVIVHRSLSVDDIQVMVNKVATPNPAPAPIAGTIRAERPPIFSLIFRGRNRFPQNGGYEVDPDAFYEISLAAKYADKKQITITKVGTFTFAPGAIVDFTVTL